MHQFILVYTSTYWYVPVHTGMYAHELNYEYVMTVTRLYTLVYASTYACKRVKKKCKQISNPRSSACF